MKRTISLILALIMMLSMSITVLAVDFKLEVDNNRIYESEPNNTKETAQQINNCQTIVGNIKDSNDFDMYSIKVDKESEIAVLVTGDAKSNSEFFIATLTGDDGKVWGLGQVGAQTDNNQTSYNSVSIHSTIPSGTYIITIGGSPQRSDGSGKTYLCYVEFVSTGNIDDKMDDGEGEYLYDKEINDTFSDAQNIKLNNSRLFRGKFEKKTLHRDEDYYWFSLAEETYISIYDCPNVASKSWPSRIMGLSLYDSNGNLICNGGYNKYSYNTFGTQADNWKYEIPYVYCILPAGKYYFSVYCNYEDYSKFDGLEYFGCINKMNPRFGVLSFQGAINKNEVREKGSLNNFKEKRNYTSGLFSDVNAESWYYSAVKTAYEYGLMSGNSSTTFNPNGSITLSETIALASRLNSIFYNGSDSFSQTNPWYQAYVDYAINNGVIQNYAINECFDYPLFLRENHEVTRAEFVSIIHASLPDEVWNSINNISSIPDVKENEVFFADVLDFYKAGILTGSDGGKFNPRGSIQRSEVAAITSRIFISSLRQTLSL